MTERSPDGAVRVVLVDDHAMFRAGVRAELAAVGAGRVEVVGEAADVGRRRRGRPDAAAPTWCCSTCTCPAAAASR